MKELDFALAPPAGIVDAPGHIGPDVMAAPAHAVEDRVVLLEGQRIRAPKLGVEIGRVLRHFGQGVVDLPIDNRLRFGIAILERESRAACGTASPSSS